MKFDILMGVPEMKEYWDNLCNKAENNKLGNEKKLFKKLVKTLNSLSNNPNYNSLSTHEIKPLTMRYGRKVWQSYLENRTPAAGRIFWTYGPAKNQITIIGIEPHPDDNKISSYQKVQLSNLPI